MSFLLVQEVTAFSMATNWKKKGKKEEKVETKKRDSLREVFQRKEM